jgi:hypothetical protein
MHVTEVMALHACHGVEFEIVSGGCRVQGFDFAMLQTVKRFPNIAIVKCKYREEVAVTCILKSKASRQDGNYYK